MTAAAPVTIEELTEAETDALRQLRRLQEHGFGKLTLVVRDRRITVAEYTETKVYDTA